MISLLLSILATSWNPSLGFYLLPTRAWEMLAGGIVFLVTRQSVLPSALTRWIELTGIILILSSVALLDTSMPWPGGWALPPVIGTALILMAARPDSAWTRCRLVQWLGRCSYSLYLWHWPLAVSLIYLNKQNDVPAIALGLMLTLLLGGISNCFIEEPARRSGARRQTVAVVILVAGVFLLLMSALWIRAHDGVSGRMPAPVEKIISGAQDKNPRIDECHTTHFPNPECTYGGKELGVIVIGDSHAASVMRTIESVLPDKHQHVLDWSMSSCPTLLGAKRSPESLDNQCSQFISYALKKSDESLDEKPLIVVNRLSVFALGFTAADRSNDKWLPIYFGNNPVPTDKPDPMHLANLQKALIETTCRFASHRPVYLVRPIPEMPFDVPKGLARPMLYGSALPDSSISLAEYHERHAFVWAAQDAVRNHCNVRILDPLPYLCWDGRCHGVKDGHSLYYDDDHLSEYGARLLAPMFSQVFSEKNH